MPFLLACNGWKAEHPITHYIQEPRNPVELSWGPSKVLQPFTAAYSTPKNSPGARGWHLSFPILPAWNVNFHSQISQIKWNVCVTRQDWYSTHGGVETLHQAIAMPISQSGIFYNKYNGPSALIVQIIILNVVVSLRNRYSLRSCHHWSPLLDSLYIMINRIEPV